MDLKSQNFEVRGELVNHFLSVLDSGNYVSGVHVEQFERDFAASHDSDYAIACNSGTSALEIILKSLDIGPGDEVIIPALTFVATMEAVVSVGATPILLDVNPETWNLSINSVRQNISNRTKAIIFVHLHGSAAGIVEMARLASEQGIHLIEDAAQAHLARAEGTSVGKFGIAAAFSFYPGKNLGALGEGGAIVTQSEALQTRAKLIRNWGAAKKYVHETRGSNYRMDELQAGFLRIKLQKLPVWTEKRRQLSETYNEFFDSCGIKRPHNTGIDHSYHIYAIRVKRREDLAREFSLHGIEHGIHYPSSLDLMKPWSSFFKVPGTPNVSQVLSREFLSLPLHESLQEEDLKYICGVVRKNMTLFSAD